MSNEETILDHQYTTESQKNENTTVEQSKAEKKQRNSKIEKGAYAAGGFVAGVGVTMAGQAAAAPKAEVPQPDEPEVVGSTPEAQAEEPVAAENSTESDVPVVTVETNGTKIHITGDAQVDIQNGVVHVSAAHVEDAPAAVGTDSVEPEVAAPAPEETIVATSTGVRVAQVDDDASFSQAFADARAQVGPGGVFEWRGRVYGTYYKNEWDNMSAEQKHDYQSSIDYSEVRHLSEDDAHSVHHAAGTAAHESHVEPTLTSNETADAESVDAGDVKVLQVGETDLNGDGMLEDAAILEVNGHEVMIVDIDRDGMADIAFCDVDGDGQVEMANVTGEGLIMPDQTAGDVYMAQAESAPDYMNDANVGIYEV